MVKLIPPLVGPRGVGHLSTGELASNVLRGYIKGYPLRVDDTQLWSSSSLHFSEKGLFYSRSSSKSAFVLSSSASSDSWPLKCPLSFHRSTPTTATTNKAMLHFFAICVELRTVTD